MSQRGEVTGMVALMKTTMKKVERGLQNVDTFYKTEGIPRKAEAASKKASKTSP